MSVLLNAAQNTPPARASRRGLTLVAAVASLTVLLAGCENMGPRERGTAQGAGIGAVAGAAIGAMTGGGKSYNFVRWTGQPDGQQPSCQDPPTHASSCGLVGSLLIAHSS